MNRPPPLTVGKLIEILQGLDPGLPIFTHANNHSANDNMKVVLEYDGWFRIQSSDEFGKPPTLGVQIGNPHAPRGEVVWSMWRSEKSTGGDK